MNHWFLVGRDVMWFCVAATPLVWSFVLGTAFGKEEFSESDAFPVTMLVVSIAFGYPLLLAALYYGWIK